MISTRQVRRLAFDGLSLATLIVAMTVGPVVSAAGQGEPPNVWMAGGHAGGIHAVALSPNNQTIASASFDTTVKLFDVSTGLLNHTLIGHDVAALSVAFSPDGSNVVSGGYEGLAQVWNASTGAGIRTLVGHSGPVNAVAYSPDGTKIATGSGDGTAKVWNAADGSLVGTLSGHTDWVYSVAFSPDGATLATGSGDGTIRVWRLSDGVCLGTLTGHAGYVLSVGFSPDGTQLVSGSTDDTVRLWRLSDGATLGTYTDQTLYVYVTQFSPDGALIASGAGDGTLVLRRASDGVVERTITASGGVHSLAFSSNGASVYVGTDDGMASVWSAGDGSFQKWLTAQWGMINGVAISPDNAVVATVSEDGTAVLRDLTDGSTDLRFAAHDDVVSSVAFSPDGALLCTGSYDFTAALWNSADGSLVRTLSGHTDAVLSVAFAPDGLSVLTGGSDAAILVWRVSDGAQIGSYSGHTGAVWSLAFSPDGSRLASGGADGKVRVWNVSDQTQVWEATAADSVVRAVAFSPDGSAVATGAVTSATGTLKLWSASDGAPIASSTGTTDPIRAVAFSPEGLVIATGGDRMSQGRLQFWQASNLTLLQTFDEETGTAPGSTGVTGLAYTGDSLALVYGRFDGTTAMAVNPFWPLPTTLAVSHIDGQIAELVQLSAILTVPLSGAPILGKDITFSLAGTGVGTATTNGAGQATLGYRIPEAFGVSEQSVGASFAGDAAYAAAGGSSTLTISKANTAVIVDSAVGVVGETATLRARLRRTTDDQPLAGHSLSFRVESTPAGSGVTDADGYASVDFAIPMNFGGGDKVITVDYAGDANHKVCTAYGTLTVERINCTMDVQNAEGRFGETVTLRAALSRVSPPLPLEGREVSFKVGGTAVGSGTTDATGAATLDYVISDDLSAGENEIIAEFAGDASFSPAAGSGTLTALRKVTALAASDASGMVSQTVNLSATLTVQATSAPLEGRTVSFTVEGTNAGSAVTDTNGVASAAYPIPDSFGAGTLALDAQFAGDTHHEPSSASASLTVSKASTTLWTVDRTGTISEDVILRAYDLKRTSDNQLLVGKTVIFKIDGTAVGTGTTDSGGDAVLIWNITDGAATRSITTEFAGDAAYNPSSASSTLTCETWSAKLVTFDRTARITDWTELKARLLRSDNTVLYNKPIDFSVDGTFVITRRTDAEGYARYPFYTVPDGAGAGLRTIQVDWRGTGGYLPISKTAALVVLKALPYIWVLNKSVPQGSVVSLYAYFRRLYDYAKQEAKPVSFRIDGTWVADVTTGVGDDAGVARYYYPSTESVGYYTIRCEFAGDAWVEAGSGEGTLTVY